MKVAGLPPLLTAAVAAGVAHSHDTWSRDGDCAYGAGYVMTDETIEAAVDAWCSDEAAAREWYGDISTWNTSAVTDMKGLFSPWHGSTRRPHMERCNPDVGGFNTSSVTTMERTFSYAATFNRDISGWDVGKVR